MDSATTPTQLAAHRVFVYHDRQRAAVNAALREGSERT